jgi:diguanylate cyclase (GGDEF)-like protein
MLHAIWKGGSLRSWIAIGMAVAILPLGASAIGGYLVLGRGVVASFQDVAARQRNQLDPTQRLRLLLADATEPLDDFVDEGDPRDPAAYREARGRIESLFADLGPRMQRDSALRSLVARAEDDWTSADRIATRVLSVRRAAGDTANAAQMDEFHGLVNSADDKLGALYEDLAADVHADHDQALRDVERSEWLAVAAAILSALAILVGVLIIGRVISGSVERLVSGAERFAAGDRGHRIDVTVPPELHRVAEEFNRMIGRIHESEDALADLARRDSLTRLLNRRAFDEALSEMFARQERFGEPFALVLFDLDHFKRVNDIHGHAAGDEVLRSASAALLAGIRPFDRVFRAGGEEFAALLSGGDRTTARLAADRLREAVGGAAVTIGGTRVVTTVSVGVAMSHAAPDGTALVAAADAALYRAKETGRNRVVVSGEEV